MTQKPRDGWCDCYKTKCRCACHGGGLVRHFVPPAEAQETPLGDRAQEIHGCDCIDDCPGCACWCHPRQAAQPRRKKK